MAETLQKLERDGLLEIGAAMEALRKEHPDLHDMVLRVVRAAVKEGKDAMWITATLLDEIEHDNAHPLYLWIMEIRLKVKAADCDQPTTMRPPQNSSAALQSGLEQTAIAVNGTLSRAHRAKLPTLNNEAELEAQERERPGSRNDAFPVDQDDRITELPSEPGDAAQ